MKKIIHHQLGLNYQQCFFSLWFFIVFLRFLSKYFKQYEEAGRLLMSNMVVKDKLEWVSNTKVGIRRLKLEIIHWSQNPDQWFSNSVLFWFLSPQLNANDTKNMSLVMWVLLGIPTWEFLAGLSGENKIKNTEVKHRRSHWHRPEESVYLKRRSWRRDWASAGSSCWVEHLERSRSEGMLKSCWPGWPPGFHPLLTTRQHI